MTGGCNGRVTSGTSVLCNNDYGPSGTGRLFSGPSMSNNLVNNTTLGMSSFGKVVSTFGTWLGLVSNANKLCDPYLGAVVG